ncbi:MAG: transcriptional regulator [Pseudomonadota bacterium]
METHKAKRVEIIIEAPMQRRLTNALEGAGVTGYTILPVRGGSGRSGAWTREGQVTKAGGMVAVVCLIRPERLDGLLDAAFSVVETHIGVVSVTDAEVLRAERF